MEKNAEFLRLSFALQASMQTLTDVSVYINRVGNVTICIYVSRVVSWFLTPSFDQPRKFSFSFKNFFEIIKRKLENDLHFLQIEPNRRAHYCNEKQTNPMILCQIQKIINILSFLCWHLTLTVSVKGTNVLGISCLL